MSLTTTNPPYYQKNNPTKEIWASSGIFTGAVYAPTPYAIDIPDNTLANTGRNTTSTTSSTTPAPSSNALFVSDLSNHNYYIDDMLVFNKYIHYASGIGGMVRTFDPESFLQQATNTFNAYSLENR